MSVPPLAGAVQMPAAFQPLLDRMRSQPLVALIVGAAAAVALVAALLLWGRAPDYKPLYASVSDRDGGAIIAALQQMNVPYKFAEGGGVILVPAEKLPEARLKLAAQGLPKASGVGFELMDNQKFGTSHFAEQINYQRALEGELARSIESLASVQLARVHLAIPKPSLFVREQKKPTASIVLNLHRGRSIDEGQVSAIVHLVSSSVPELDAKSVTVVDQRGNLLSAANAGLRGLDLSQFKYAQELEQGYVRRIETILQPIFGASNVRAQVTTDIDFSVTELTDEKYRPNQEPGMAAVRSQQSSESNQNNGAPPGGIPGALSNQAPANPTAPVTAASAASGIRLRSSTELDSQRSAGAAAPAGNVAGNGRKDSVTNFEVDRTIRHVQQGAGALKRLSVAVVVNNRTIVDKDGKPKSQPLTPAELEQVRNLVKDAMGYSEARGDSLNVLNSQFVSDEASEPNVPFWRDREIIEIAKSAGSYLLLAGLALFVWLSVLRPLLRKHLAPPAAALPVDAPSTQTDAAAAQETVSEGQKAVLQREEERHEGNMEYMRRTAGGNPRMVASLITQWMNEDE